MSFQSVEQILKVIEKQPGWEIQHEYRRLLEVWTEIVGDHKASHSRPLYLSRKVLHVATSSSVWAQNLSLQRYSLLKKIHKILAIDLVDIRFSSGGWHQTKPLSNESACQNHPSSIDIDTNNTSSQDLFKTKDPEAALNRWVVTLEQRSLNLPLCPQCQSPTPEGELERWGVCACCLYSPNRK